MKRAVRRLADEKLELLVIGGGITGAGIARDAALRGIRVGLVDQADFASGTSSASSKLIHGGLRYLEQAALGRVAQSCRERWLLRQLAPQWVQSRRFLLPIYQGDQRGWGRMRLGLTLYDCLARRRCIEPHSSVSAAEALRLEPSLSDEGLRGAFLYEDCQTDDARFCLDTIQHAATLGAVCANYVEVTGFVGDRDRPAAVRVMDRLSQDEFQIRARVFVNATGPWASRLPGSSVELSPTKGVHLVLPALTRQHAITFQARRDGRILFVLPWGQCSLVGTTDTLFAGDPATAAAEPADVEYLLAELRRVLALSGDLITTFAGVRPLLKSDAAAGRRSREHRIYQEAANLLGVVGGKYTTFRLMAAEVVDRVVGLLGRTQRCLTATTPLPIFRPPPPGQALGAGAEVCASDIAFACEQEMAVTLNDLMRRRTSLALSPHGSPAMAARLAPLMARQLGWDDRQTAAQIAAYQREWQRHQP